MRQRGDRLRFSLEACAGRRIGRECFGQDLDRDVPIQFRVARAIHLAHAASAERRDDLIGAEACAGAESQCVVIIRLGRLGRRDDRIVRMKFGHARLAHRSIGSRTRRRPLLLGNQFYSRGPETLT